MPDRSISAHLQIIKNGAPLHRFNTLEKLLAQYAIADASALSIAQGADMDLSSAHRALIYSHFTALAQREGWEAAKGQIWLLMGMASEK